ncbi:hypothetical protein [Rubritalea halochordaticola]
MKRFRTQISGFFALPMMALLGGGELSAVSFELHCYDRPTKEITEVGEMELRPAPKIKRIIQDYHPDYDFSIPREILSAEQRKQGIAEAKKQLLLNQAKYDEIVDKENQWGIVASTIKQANRAVAGVIGALGEPSDIEWLRKQFPQSYWTVLPVAQIMMRHGIGFDPESAIDYDHVHLARVMAAKRHKAAAAWLYQNKDKIRESGLDPLNDLMKLMVLNQMPETEQYAKEIIDAYKVKTATADGMKKGNGIGPELLHAVPWAIAYLSAYTEEASSQPHFEGLKIHSLMRQDVVLLISEDPTMWIDIIFGKPGKVSQSQQYLIRQMAWNRRMLRAAIAKRGQQQSSQLEAHMKKNFTLMTKEHNLLQVSGGDLSLLFREAMAVDLSPLRASSEMASDVQNRSGPNMRVHQLYRDVPWVMLEWYPKALAEYLGDEKADLFHPYRLSPFDHEEIKKTLLGGKLHLKCAVDSVLLWHKYLNNSFKPPIEYQLGGIHSPALRLPGEMAAIGMHSLIRTIAIKKQETLRVGIMVDTEHHDAGGLASAITQLSKKMIPYSDNHGRKQISNLRWECGQESGALKYTKTTESGMHIFEGTFTRPDMRDVHLYFDWNSPGKTYVLAHALYEPEFNLP